MELSTLEQKIEKTSGKLNLLKLEHKQAKIRQNKLGQELQNVAEKLAQLKTSKAQKKSFKLGELEVDAHRAAALNIVPQLNPLLQTSQVQDKSFKLSDLDNNPYKSNVLKFVLKEYLNTVNNRFTSFFYISMCGLDLAFDTEIVPSVCTHQITISGGNDGVIGIYDKRNRTTVSIRNELSKISSLALNSDNVLLAVGYENGCIELRDLTSKYATIICKLRSNHE